MTPHTHTRESPAPVTAAGAAFPIAPTADPSWLLVEEGWSLPREHEIESLFTVANGYVGTRGTLAEGSALSRPATFAAGVFDVDPGGSLPELAILPDWTRLVIVAGSTPVSLEEGVILEHRRVLDLRQGVLWREWRHEDTNGRVTRLSYLRLASLADRHVLLQCVLVTPENYSGLVRVEGTVGGRTAQGRWAQRIETASEAALLVRTTARGVTVAMALASEMQTGEGRRIERALELADERLVERWVWEAEIGEAARLCRVAAVHTSRADDPPDRAAVRHLERLPAHAADRIVRSHARAWQECAEAADVRIEGDDAARQALRFAAYHLIGAGNPGDERASIGARGLTGHVYKGHVFWDTEIYLLPFYVFTDPATARALLAYRYHTLPAAREKARVQGYRGALYAWESADTGEETTPTSTVAPDGEVVPVLTGEEEHHISADVAYAVWHYWQATGDDAFLLEAGAEILLETARFWASRGRVEADGRYHIRRVIGPDEYHEGVDDNAYTNVMASWNLARGAETAGLLAARWPERWRGLARRLDLGPGEPAAWRRLAAVMETGFNPSTGLFEQFRGFFDLEEVDLAAHGSCAVPIDICLGRERTRRSKVIKQADVVALSALLWDAFPREVHAANFRYYEPRTGHGSSLSPAIHALVAARLGDTALAERYFRQAAEIDLADNMGNAAGGVHIAALGGLWQAAVLGMAGMRLGEDGLVLDPHLLPAWRELAFRVRWRGRVGAVTVGGDPPRLEVEVSGEGAVRLAVPGGPTTVAAPGRRYVTRRDGGGWEAWIEEAGP